jgi:hypothetical protein
MSPTEPLPGLVGYVVLSYGTRSNVFEIDDQAVAAGATVVSAIPKQYSNGSPVVHDKRYVSPSE